MSAQERVLPALDAVEPSVGAAHQRRGGRAEVDVAGVELLLVGRRPAPDELAGVGRELEHAVAPGGLAVVRRVPGRDQDAAGVGLDHRAGPGPDRRVGVRAARRLDDLVPVRAERVPDVDDLTARPVDRDDVALVGRRVADVAAGRREHEPARDVERRPELLVGRVARDRDRPAAAGHLGAVGQVELVDDAVGRDGVDVLPVGIRRRRGVRDLGRSLPAVDARRGVRPQDVPASVERDRLPVARRHDEAAADEDRRRVDRAGNVN